MFHWNLLVIEFYSRFNCCYFLNLCQILSFLFDVSLLRSFFLRCLFPSNHIFHWGLSPFKLISAYLYEYCPRSDHEHNFNLNKFLSDRQIFISTLVHYSKKDNSFVRSILPINTINPFYGAWLKMNKKNNHCRQIEGHNPLTYWILYKIIHSDSWLIYTTNNSRC